MRIHQWIAVALAACLALTTSSSDAKAHGTNTACGKFRVRQSWTQLTPEEKKLYQNAIISAMKTREFNEFAKIHMESMSEMQAHSTCAFLLWHKRYLLAYESMLRSQGPEYACVTVPYWDVMKDYASMIDGTCKDIYSCSSIVRDMGGSLTSPPESRTMDGATVSGACYASFAGESYCDDNKKCGCVPRGDLTAQLPSSCGYEGLFNQIAYSTSFGQFTQGLQYGLHNEVHGAMGGFMGTFTSPVDPLFWNWHATIDFMWYLYQQCHVSSSMSDKDIRKSVFGFLQTGDCRYSKDAPETNLNAKMVQQSKTNGVMYDATKNPIVGKYFEDLPTSVGDYVAFNPTGEYAYKYMVPEAFNQKLLQSPDLCRVYYNEWSKNTPAPTTPAPVAKTPAPAPATTTTAPATTSPKPGATTATPAATTSEPATTTPAPEATTAAPRTTAKPGATTEAPANTTSAPKSTTAAPTTTTTPSFDFDDLNGKNNTTTPSKDPAVTNAPGPAPVKPATSTDGSQSSNQNVLPTPGSSSSGRGSQSGVPPPSVGEEENDPCKGSSAVVSDGDFVSDGSAYWEWYTASREQLNTVFPGNITEIAHQMEYVGCLTFGETFGIKNFTQEFMDNFRLQDSRPKCQQRVQDVQEGKQQVVLETKAFKAQSVAIKPGVTPAAPVNPDDAYKQYEQRVSLESGMSSPTSGAAGVAGGMTMLSMMTMVLVMVSMWS